MAQTNVVVEVQGEVLLNQQIDYVQSESALKKFTICLSVMLIHTTFMLVAIMQSWNHMALEIDTLLLNMDDQKQFPCSEDSNFPRL